MHPQSLIPSHSLSYFMHASSLSPFYSHSHSSTLFLICPCSSPLILTHHYAFHFHSYSSSPSLHPHSQSFILFLLALTSSSFLFIHPHSLTHPDTHSVILIYLHSSLTFLRSHFHSYVPFSYSFPNFKSSFFSLAFTPPLLSLFYLIHPHYHSSFLIFFHVSLFQSTILTHSNTSF